jgi:transposase-like protein
VLDCWLSPRATYPAAEAFVRRTIGSTQCTPVHVVTTKLRSTRAPFRTCAPEAKHLATGFYNRVLSPNRCERNHGYDVLADVVDDRRNGHVAALVGSARRS